MEEKGKKVGPAFAGPCGVLCRFVQSCLVLFGWRVGGPRDGTLSASSIISELVKQPASTRHSRLHLTHYPGNRRNLARRSCLFPWQMTKRNDWRPLSNHY